MLSKIKNHYLVFIISFLIYFPIILWGGYFLDDNYRSIDAFYGWTGDYRPIADWIFYILGLGTDFIDTFPLNYIIQFFIVSYFNILLTEKIRNTFLLDESSKNYISLSVSLLFLSPFFMQNLYFRYDSLIMVLSVIFACIPFFFNKKKIDLICCILVLFTYQSSIVGYMCIVILKLLAMNQYNENRGIIYKELGKSILVFMISIFIFFLSAKLFITPNNYAENHTLTVTSFQMLIENIKYSLNILAFSNSILDYALIVFSLIISLSFIFTVILHNSNLYKTDIFLIFIGIILAFTICLLNLNIFLLKPRLYSRTYIGVGFILFLIGINLTLLMSKKDEILSKYIYFYKFLLFCTFVMCINIFYVGYNYIQETEYYTKDLTNNISYDLSIEDKKNYKLMMAYGKPYITLRAESLVKKYPILLNIFYDNEHIFFYKYRKLSDLLKNKGFTFQGTDYSNINLRKEYNSYIHSKPNIERLDYNIFITKDNKLFIYFKKDGELIKYPLDGSRLD